MEKSVKLYVISRLPLQGLWNWRAIFAAGKFESIQEKLLRQAEIVSDCDVPCNVATLLLSYLWGSREIYLKTERKVPTGGVQTIWGREYRMRGIRRVLEMDGDLVEKAEQMLQWTSEDQTENFVCDRLKGSSTVRNYRLSSILNWQWGSLATWSCC